MKFDRWLIGKLNIRRWSIRRRILITFMGLTLLGGTIQIGIAGWELQGATLDYFRHDLETHALVASALLAEPLESVRDNASVRPATALQRPLAALQTELAPHEFSVLSANHSVIAYKGGMSGQSGVPISGILALDEVADASVGWSFQDGYIYAAAPIRYEGSSLGYFLIRTPLSDAYAQANARWLELGITMLPAAALIVLASFWIARTISKPVEALRDSALKIADGALDSRIRVTSLDELGEFAQAFNFMAERLETLMKAQRSFVSNAAHELRTPLTSLQLRLEALGDTAMTSAQREAYLGEIRQDVDHMVNLVNALLTLARAEEGRREPEAGGYDAGALLHDLARRWRIEAGRANLGFDAALPQELPDLAIPAHHLRLIVDNLLSNAIKYTPQGRIDLKILVEDGVLRLIVSDTGQGFAPEDAARLFDRFYRTDAARLQKISGVGLGLAILQAVAAQYGGKVSASSPGVDQGARFEVVLPIDGAGAPDGDLRAARAAPLSRASDVP